MTKRFSVPHALPLSELPLPGLVYRSASMRQLAEQIHKLKASNLTILLTGESGTGKELVARAIHALSPRRKQPFVAYNCTSIPRDLLESELFGHKKGAFTGAIADALGVIRAADGGTLLLDEIGDLPLDLQPKLLRFLQEGEVHALGETYPRKVDVRLIAATNRPLAAFVEQERFRPDLYYRLQIVGLHLPPLRERAEDLPPLLEHFLAMHGAAENKPGLRLEPAAREALLAYHWPGNVRELSNEIQRVAALAEAGIPIAITDLSARFQPPSDALFTLPPITLVGKRKVQAVQVTIPPEASLPELQVEFERVLILAALERQQGNILRAAAELGWSRQTLRTKMQLHGLQATRSKAVRHTGGKKLASRVVPTRPFKIVT